MSLTFRKAEKSQARLRLAIYGPSGSGKTYTALRLAAGIGGRIAVIDTERGSASKYADRFEYDVLELPQNDVATYVEGIRAAAGYTVLIIDSLSHAWQELLAEIDRLAAAKYGGNKWSAWSEGTPKHQALLDAMLRYDGHLIATMRSKTDWVLQQDDRGRNVPKRIGLAPEQRSGTEYEFDLLMEINADHLVHIIKDRTGKFQDRIIDKPGEDLGKELAAWLSEGTVSYARLWTDKKQWVLDQLNDLGLAAKEAQIMLGVKSLLDCPYTPEEGIERLREIRQESAEMVVTT